MRETVDGLLLMWQQKDRAGVVDALSAMKPLKAALVASYLVDELDGWNRDVFLRTLEDLLAKGNG